MAINIDKVKIKVKFLKLDFIKAKIILKDMNKQKQVFRAMINDTI